MLREIKMYSTTCREVGDQLVEGRLPSEAVFMGEWRRWVLCVRTERLCVSVTTGKWMAVGLCVLL